MITGAEKSRPSEGTGEEGTSRKRNTSVSLRSDNTPLVPRAGSPSRRNGRSRPSASMSPTTNGMCIGSLAGCPGMGGQRCVTVSS
jgi:hypothetical protein